MKLLVTRNDGSTQLLEIAMPVTFSGLDNPGLKMWQMHDAQGTDYFFNKSDGTYDGWGRAVCSKGETQPPMEEIGNDPKLAKNCETLRAEPAPAPPAESLSNLMKALDSANSLCRSAMQIAKRRGEETNWESFTARLEESLNLQHQVMQTGITSAKEVPAVDHNSNCPVTLHAKLCAVDSRYGYMSPICTCQSAPGGHVEGPAPEETLCMAESDDWYYCSIPKAVPHLEHKAYEHHNLSGQLMAAWPTPKRLEYLQGAAEASRRAETRKEANATTSDRTLAATEASGVIATSPGAPSPPSGAAPTCPRCFHPRHDSAPDSRCKKAGLVDGTCMCRYPADEASPKSDSPRCEGIAEDGPCLADDDLDCPVHGKIRRAEKEGKDMRFFADNTDAKRAAESTQEFTKAPPSPPQGAEEARAMGLSAPVGMPYELEIMAWGIAEQMWRDAESPVDKHHCWPGTQTIENALRKFAHAYAAHREAQLRERVRELERRLTRLTHFHEPDCVAVLDDESDSVLYDFQTCTCESSRTRAESAEARIRSLEVELASAKAGTNTK